MVLRFALCVSLVALASAAGLDEMLQNLADLHRLGVLDKHGYEQAKEKVLTEASVSVSSEVTASLAELGLAHLAGDLERGKVVTRDDLLLLGDLSEEAVAKYLPTSEFGERLKLLHWVKQQQQEKGEAPVPAKHDDELARLVADMFEENNQKLLLKMQAMIEDARLSVGPPTGGASQPHRQLQTAASAEQLDGASIYLEDDNAKMVLGPDTSIARAREGVLATSALQLGTVATCDADDHKGTIRFDVDKEKLQYCDGAKWKAAGGAASDAAENEPCNADARGSFQFDASTKILATCARQLFAEHFFRSNALQCTATARVLIPAECSAVS